MVLKCKKELYNADGTLFRGVRLLRIVVFINGMRQPRIIPMRVLITGAFSPIGCALMQELSNHSLDVIATDIAPTLRFPLHYRFTSMDVRSQDPDKIIAHERPDVVIHLAATQPQSNRQLAYQVNVIGTRNVLDACIAHGVKRLVVTSSNAAYGYHADNPQPLTESAPLRGNPEFSYADHHRQIENILQQARIDHPQLEQVILGIATVLGAGVENIITALFHRPQMLAVNGSDGPFSFIWIHDLTRVLVRAIAISPQGVFNVAADGVLSVHELAQRLGKPVLRLPVWGLKALVTIAYTLRFMRYHPSQVSFLQHRPVLDNRALKEAFGYTPELTSRQVFDLWQKNAGL
jgi:UDP-glucose 4-epimerase